MEDINVSSFEGCSGLVSVKFPKEMNYLSINAFDGCVNFHEIFLPEIIDTLWCYHSLYPDEFHLHFPDDFSCNEFTYNGNKDDKFYISKNNPFIDEATYWNSDGIIYTDEELN